MFFTRKLISGYFHVEILAVLVIEGDIDTAKSIFMSKLLFEINRSNAQGTVILQSRGLRFDDILIADMTTLNTIKRGQSLKLLTV